MINYIEPNGSSQPTIEWAQNFLLTNGYGIKEPPHTVRAMPWSIVTHFSTSKGSIYLKEMAPLFSLEPTLIKAMAEWDKDSVPKVIAINNDLRCFLMEDAGVPLSKYLKEAVEIDLLVKALAMCASSQRKAVKHVDTLLSLGVPDWGLAKLPELYLQLIKQEDLLKADGLTPAEIKVLQGLHPKFSFICDSLSKYNIPETLEHTDFHGNNILLKDNHLTIGDWGDAVISHPFYSLASYLNSATRHYGLREGDEDYINLQDIYLNKWIEFEDKDRLLEVFHLIRRLRPLQIAFSFIRVKLCLNFGSSFVFTGYIAEALRDFIKAET